MNSAHPRIDSGDRKQYALEREAISGGQADVLRGVHKSSGSEIAFKRLRGSGGASKARMHREVEVARHVDHPNVMPVLDVDPTGMWFVMPWAEGNLEDLRSRVGTDDAVRQCVTEIASGLAAAHEHGWVHRDVNPHNVLLLDNRWVVSDWGLVRRPRGQTTVVRTRVGAPFGTEGFAAPELSVDGHNATEAADVFSLGQTIGWLRTGKSPVPNVALLPDPSDPWRPIVRRATILSSTARVQTMSELLELVAEELDIPTTEGDDEAATLLDAASNGDVDATLELLRLGAESPEDNELLLDFVAAVPSAVLHQAFVRDPPLASSAVVAMGRSLVEAEWGRRDFDYANTPLGFFLTAAKVAIRLNDWDLLDDASDALFAGEAQWNRFATQREIFGWLPTLTGVAADRVSRALRRHKECAQRFTSLVEGSRRSSGLDAKIDAVLRAI